MAGGKAGKHPKQLSPIMNKLPLILIGGGGHCHSSIDVVELEGRYSVYGILDRSIEKGVKVLGYPVLGDDEVLNGFAGQGYHFLITIGQIKSAAPRFNLWEKLKSTGANMATVISPRSYVSPSASVEAGTAVFHNAVVNAKASIGFNSIINTSSLIEHDTRIGDHVHVSTGAIINGGCSIGDRTFIGSGATIVNNVNIGSDVIIGAGSVVVNDITEQGIYVGNPAKKI